MYGALRDPPCCETEGLSASGIKGVVSTVEVWSNLRSRRVEARHLKAGGYLGNQPTVQVVKKILGELRAEGLVMPVSKGIWRYVEDSDPSTVGSTSTEAVPDDVSVEDDEEPGGLQVVGPFEFFGP